MCKSIRILVSLFSVFLIGLAAASPASAEKGGRALAFSPDGGVTTMGASTCNWPTWGPVCLNVNGGGLFVASATGSTTAGAWICNKEFHVWGTYENGVNWNRYGVADCGVGRVWVDFGLNANMRDGSSICADMKEYGTGGWHANGYACINIHR
ncbi:hypothetical protein [Amycolatopsis magusensis]|uniref:hypothetical protein n=1 Tax=Amycolatopsis magusensis TaxID=882444 RepID=UPI0024A96DBA|nr:hypothetical protein [Amycolatopsis magusensis]MDI5979905.1 hypothetical protein [Amycolatopsis magusensis]